MHDQELKTKIDDSIFTKKKKIFFVGAMGSGKTEISISYAKYWSRWLGEKVSLVDLDMVKPLFRLRAVSEKIKSENVEIVTPGRHLDDADVPIIPAHMEAMIKGKNIPAVIDVGGDDIGARLTGRYHGSLSQDEIEFWYVYNAMRPFSRGADSVIDIIDSIERASRYKLTGIVHNSHLMKESTADILIENMKKAEEIAAKKDIKVRFHCIRKDLYEETLKKTKNTPILPIEINMMPEWM